MRLRKLAEEKDELLAQIRKLKNHLEEERQKHSKVDSSYTDGERMENGTDLHLIEMQSKLTWRTGETTFEPRAHMLTTLSVFFFSLQEMPTGKLVNTSSSSLRQSRK